MPKIPTSFIVAIAAAILATLIRGLLGSMAAGVLISVLIALFAVTAVTRSRKSVRLFAIGLAIYGGAFVAQALLLPSYVGSRALDAGWGLLLVAVAVFVYSSRGLAAYFEGLQASTPSGPASAGQTKESSAP